MDSHHPPTPYTYPSVQELIVIHQIVLEEFHELRHVILEKLGKILTIQIVKDLDQENQRLRQRTKGSSIVFIFTHQLVSNLEVSQG